MVGGSTYFAAVVHNVFTPDECKDLVNLTNSKGYTPALLNKGAGMQSYEPDYRFGWRCIIDCSHLADYMLEVLRPVLPDVFGPNEIVDVNERCRFLFYEEGQEFAPHVSCSENVLFVNKNAKT